MFKLLRVVLSFVFAFAAFVPAQTAAVSSPQTTPAAPQTDASGVSEIALGSQHTCAVVDGGVKCWGNNEYGQLGDGTNQNRSTPVDVAGLGATSGVKHIWAGEYFTCAILDTNNDGLSSVKCWGRNDSGQLGNGTFTTRNTPDFVTGSESETWQIGSYAGVGSHSCVGLGDLHTAQITPQCWGANGFSQLGDGTTTDSNHPITSTNLLDFYDLGILRVVTGGAFTCVMGGYPIIQCLGANGAGQLGDGTTTASITGTWVINNNDDYFSDFEANGSHACFVKQWRGVRYGVFCWGFNGYGQIGISTTQNVLTPTQISLAEYAVGANLAMGEFHTCNYDPVSWYDPHFPPFASVSGLKCWGRNDYGQLGDGTTTTRLSPVQTTLANQRLQQVAAGGYHTCAITDVDQVLCWGRNDSGQLGDGTFAQHSLPVAVAGFAPITETTITITSFDDSNYTACNLRNALRAAENHWSWYDCPPALGKVTIQIPEGVYTNTHGSFGSWGGLFATTDVTIKGAGANKTALTVAPAINDRTLNIGGSANVTISDLSIRGGQSPTDTQKGGGLRNSGVLTLTNVVISQNADGGLENLGELVATNSTIMNNEGGGLINNGSAIVVNATFSGNTSNADGAEIRNEGTLLATHVTLNHAANTTASIYSSGHMLIDNSIINSTSGCAISASGHILSAGHNLANSSGCGAYFTGDGDLVGVDPRLGPIAQNAPGQTPTHALLPGSPAIDAGLFVGVTTDQRGVARPQGEDVDIGAYEYRPIADAPARVYLPRLAK